jgi:alkyldihydroxyacetonephosphate synthase
MSQRSLWGWGHTDAALPLDEVRARVEGFFGPLDEAHPAEPRVPPARVERLPLDFITQDPTDRAAHALGKSYPDRVRGFAGDFSTAPDLVARPTSEAQVEQLFELAERERLSVTPFGGGSSVVRGVEPTLGPNHRGTLTLDLAELRGVHEVDDVSRLARIGAGTFGPELERALGAHHLTLRHFPQSFEFSTLGGWVATRAGGHFATVLTHIDDLVHSVRLLTPRGAWQTRSVPASGAGPDPARLVIGSEGTLGVITEAWLRVRPKPTHRAGASVFFTDFTQAVSATRAISQADLAPANCRLLDAAEAFINGVSGDGSSVLVLGFESADHPVLASLERAITLAREHGGTCPEGAKQRTASGTGDAADTWRASFLKGPYLQDALLRLGVLADTFETACTWRQFPTLYAEVRAAMEAALERVCGAPGVVSCRFTHVYPDGPAPYFTFLGKARRGAELEQWAELKAVASDTLTRCGGTITHHHAVGRAHRPWYDRERPELFARALRAVKAELDPAGLLNPGVLL